MKLRLAVQDPGLVSGGLRMCGVRDSGDPVSQGHGPFGDGHLVLVDEKGAPRCPMCAAASIARGVDELANPGDAHALLEPDTRPYDDPRFEAIGARVRVGSGRDAGLVELLLAAHERRGVEEGQRLLIGLEAILRHPDAAARLRELLEVAGARR
jgi:hypothetical protein